MTGCAHAPLAMLPLAVSSVLARACAPPTPPRSVQSDGGVINSTAAVELLSYLAERAGVLVRQRLVLRGEPAARQCGHAYGAHGRRRCGIL